MDRVSGQDGTRRLILLGTALGVLESIVVPPAWPLRIGLANAATLLAAAGGLRPAVTVAAARSILVAAATGTWLAPSGLFSLAGGILSAVVMTAALRLPVSWVLASSLGGFASGLAQVAVFGLYAGVGPAAVLPWMPWFAAWGAATGALTGAAALGAVRRLRKGRPIDPPAEMAQIQYSFRFDTPRGA